jgi:peptide subunit release factor 1 (eRF1)
MGGNNEEEDVDANIEMWKIKKLIKGLTEARGNGTSMISLVIPVSFTSYNTAYSQRIRSLESQRCCRMNTAQLQTSNPG